MKKKQKLQKLQLNTPAAKNPQKFRYWHHQDLKLDQSEKKCLFSNLSMPKEKRTYSAYMKLRERSQEKYEVGLKINR
jgi:hypothetical protein